MGQALSFCSGCETPRDCDNCTDLHNWIMEALEDLAELDAYRETGLEPKRVHQLIGEVFGLRVDKKELDKYRAIGPIDHIQELAQADRDGRLQQAAGRRPIQL